MGPHDRAEAVVRGLHGRHPLAHGLVDGVLERAAARRHRAHLGAEQLHAEHVELLALRVDLAHEHRALQPEQRGGGGRGHAVLARPGLGDHARLAHPRGEQRLAHHVVELVRARVGQVLPLEQHAHPQALRQTRCTRSPASDGRRSGAATRRARCGTPGRPRHRRTTSRARGRPASTTRGRSGPRTRRSDRPVPAAPSALRRRSSVPPVVGFRGHRVRQWVAGRRLGVGPAGVDDEVPDEQRVLATRARPRRRWTRPPRPAAGVRPPVPRCRDADLPRR